MSGLLHVRLHGHGRRRYTAFTATRSRRCCCRRSSRRSHDGARRLPTPPECLPRPWWCRPAPPPYLSRTRVERPPGGRESRKPPASQPPQCFKGRRSGHSPVSDDIRAQAGVAVFAWSAAAVQASTDVVSHGKTGKSVGRTAHAYWFVRGSERVIQLRFSFQGFSVLQCPVRASRVPCKLG